MVKILEASGDRNSEINKAMEAVKDSGDSNVVKRNHVIAAYEKTAELSKKYGDGSDPKFRGIGFVFNLSKDKREDFYRDMTSDKKNLAFDESEPDKDIYDFNIEYPPAGEFGGVSMGYDTSVEQKEFAGVIFMEL